MLQQQLQGKDEQIEQMREQMQAISAVLSNSPLGVSEDLELPGRRRKTPEGSRSPSRTRASFVTASSAGAWGIAPQAPSVRTMMNPVCMAESPSSPLQSAVRQVTPWQPTTDLQQGMPPSPPPLASRPVAGWQSPKPLLARQVPSWPASELLGADLLLSGRAQAPQGAGAGGTVWTSTSMSSWPFAGGLASGSGASVALRGRLTSGEAAAAELQAFGGLPVAASARMSGGAGACAAAVGGAGPGSHRRATAPTWRATAQPQTHRTPSANPALRPAAALLANPSLSPPPTRRTYGNPGG